MHLRILRDLYGSWLKAEVKTSLLVREGDMLWRVENKKSEHYDNFSDDINIDEINGDEDDKIRFEEENDSEVHGEEDCGLNPKMLSKGNGLSHQQPRNIRENMDKADNLPTEKDMVTGLKGKSKKKLNNSETMENGGKSKHKSNKEDDRSPRQDLRKIDSQGQN